MKTIVDYARKVKEQHALNKNLAPIEADASASSKAYAIGQHFILNGELYKAKTAIALGDALVLDTNYEAAGSIEAQIETLDAENQTLTNNLSNEVETRAKLGAHNIFSLTIDDLKSLNTVNGTWSGNSFTMYGITYNCEVTNGYVSKITVSGTATATSTLELFGKYAAFASNKYKGNILSGCPSGGSGTSYCIIEQTSASSAGTSPTFSRDEGSGVVIGNNDYARLYIRIDGGYAISGSLIFNPMIRLASDADTTYQPYAMTNRELTEYTSDVDSKSYTKDGILVRVYRCGRQVMFLLGGTATADIAASTVLCTLDSKFVPYEVVNSIAIKGANTVVGKLNISTNGQVYFDTAISNGEGPRLTSLCYIAKNP